MQIENKRQVSEYKRYSLQYLENARRTQGTPRCRI